ncbi:hypothetical protein ACE6H2_016625 [Prunus campanulata]
MVILWVLWKHKHHHPIQASSNNHGFNDEVNVFRFFEAKCTIDDCKCPQSN